MVLAILLYYFRQHQNVLNKCRNLLYKNQGDKLYYQMDTVFHIRGEIKRLDSISNRATIRFNKIKDQEDSRVEQGIYIYGICSLHYGSENRIPVGAGGLF